MRYTACASRVSRRIWRLCGIDTNRRHRYVDNQRVKLRIVLPTTAMAKFAIDIASLESIYSLLK